MKMEQQQTFFEASITDTKTCQYIKKTERDQYLFRYVDADLGTQVQKSLRKKRMICQRSLKLPSGRLNEMSPANPADYEGRQASAQFQH